MRVTKRYKNLQRLLEGIATTTGVWGGRGRDYSRLFLKMCDY